MELRGYGGDPVEGHDGDGICGVAWVRICASSDRDCGDSYVVDGSGLREVKGYLGEARGFFPNRVWKSIILASEIRFLLLSRL